MNKFDLLLLGTIGLAAGTYILGLLHGLKRGRQTTARILRAIPFASERN